LDGEAPTWQRRHLVGWTVVDPFNTNRLVEAARQVAEANRVVGVACYDEALIVPAAQVREALGLCGVRVHAVQQCRDKNKTRVSLTDAGIPQPQSVAVATLEQARTAAAAIGYPVVLKPRGLGASLGVVKVSHPAELDAGFAAARSASYPGVPTYESGVLVEEFLDGPEISVDGFVDQGRYQPLFVARKQLGFAPYFEELGHVVDGNDELLGDRGLLEMLGAAHRVLGIQGGITHTELRITPQGPRVVEVNGRLGGDLIPYLGWLATGIDAGGVEADLAVGRSPTLQGTRASCVGIRFFYPTHNCRVLAVKVPKPGALAGIVQSGVLAEYGDELRLPPDGYVSRYAYVICTASDRLACAGSLQTAAAQVQLTEESLPAICHA
jgi:biotin carboxylase